MKKKVFITRSILSAGIDLMKDKGFEVEMSSIDRPLTYSELVEKARHFDALITMLGDRIDANFLEQNKHLKVISNYAVGFNNIDIEKARSLQIAIGNTPDVLTEATAEVALGLMISAARNFHSSQTSAAQGLWRCWSPTDHLGHALSNKTLGVIGFGRIGHRLAEMASAAFKMRVIYTARTLKTNSFNAEKVSMEELLKRSDFISIHVPLTSDTRKFISERELGLMKSSVVLVNTSRGEIIDQVALIRALKNKKIFAAGLDVTDPEPLPIDSELFLLSNAFILPHIGSATFEARSEMSLMAAENVIAGLEGGELKGRVV
ncbi:MAG: D-glycerate dehydrogenase [Bacteriovorax sp.]